MEISTTGNLGNTVLGAYIGEYNKEIKSSLEKLASGLRVTKPSDDPGSYFKAESLNRRAQRSMSISRDLEDHVSRIKSAQSYLGTVSTMLDEMLELANKAGNETNSTIRESYGEEYDNKMEALQDFISNSRYDGNLLLTGDYDSYTGAGGTAIDAQIDEEINDLYSYDILDTSATEATGLNLGSYNDAATQWAKANGQTNADSYASGIEDGDSGITRLNRNLNRLSTHLTILKGAQNALNNKASNYEAASSALVGVDDAAETTRLSALQIRQQAAASFLAQSNATSNNIIGILTGFGYR